jgi:hypothetical protein
MSGAYANRGSGHQLGCPPVLAFVTVRQTTPQPIAEPPWSDLTTQHRDGRDRRVNRKQGRLFHRMDLLRDGEGQPFSLLVSAWRGAD